jgi:PA14 domain
MSRRRLLLGAALGVGSLLPARASPGRDDSMAAAELKRAAEHADLCSASNATGSGLRGEYFAKEPLASAPLLVRVDPTIDFDATLDWPANLGGRRPSAARWTGWVKPPYGGSYRFHVEQRSARVVVARQVLVEDGVATGATIHLDAGRFYPIDVDAGRLDALVGRLVLEWTAPHGARYVVPRALLFLPTAEARS